MAKAKTRTAQFVAAAVEVLCPVCAEPQPNPDDGSFLWSRQQVTDERASAPRFCTACDVRIVITAHSTAQFRD